VRILCSRGEAGFASGCTSKERKRKRSAIKAKYEYASARLSKILDLPTLTSVLSENEEKTRFFAKPIKRSENLLETVTTFITMSIAYWHSQQKSLSYPKIRSNAPQAAGVVS
jgi:hypothetical protein